MKVPSFTPTARRAKSRLLPWKWRVAALITAVVQAIATTPCWIAVSAFTASAGHATAATPAPSSPTPAPPPVKVKTGVPAPNPTPVPLTFSFPVSETQITKANVTNELLVPMAGKTTPAENDELARALLLYAKDRRDISGFEHFVESHPTSPWSASVLTNLALIYRQTGYFSKALDDFKKAWDLSKAETVYPRTAVADRAIAGLVHLLSSIGRTEELQPLLDSIQGRKLGGTSATEVLRARSSLVVMFKNPGISFKCGPFALGNIQRLSHPEQPLSDVVRKAQSSPKGFSLAQLQDFSDQMNLGLQMAKRNPGAPLIIPAVVHWKVGHYAAILKKTGDTYLVKDPTFEREMSLTPQAIDAEASGYFLVPQGNLPDGWGAVSSSDGAKVWGRGLPDTKDGKQTKKCDPSTSCPSPGMAVASILLFLVCLHITDTPLAYTPPAGPEVSFTVTYNQYELSNYGSFVTSNLGNNWIHPWQSYVIPPSYSGGVVTVVLRGGGSEDYPSSSYNPATQTYGPQLQLQTSLFINGNYYERRYPDGSKEIFNYPSLGNVYLTEYDDPQGNKLIFHYESVADGCRLTQIYDALNQITTLHYDLNLTDPQASTVTGSDLKITSIEDPFGRVVRFGYKSVTPQNQEKKYVLTSITDVVGIISEFTYDGTTDNIIALTTPYGTTKFNAFQSGNGDDELVITDPRGGKERALAIYSLPDFPPEPAPNVPFANTNHPLTNTSTLGMLNTYYWDKKAMMDAPGDISKAHIYHWLVGDATHGASGIVYCEKLALESRVWYDYNRLGTPYTDVGTSDRPTGVARLLDDGSTQYSQYKYNMLGQTTLSIDPAGRQMQYVYSNNIDLTDVEVLSSANDGTVKAVLQHIDYFATDGSGNNPHPHLPQYVYDASGQKTTLDYTSLHQIASITNPKGEQITYTYNPTTHYLSNITAAGPNGNNATLDFTYDGYGRIHTVTDSDGDIVTQDYDALNRLTVTTYPDGTYEQDVYNILDLGWHRDRMGRWTTLYHDATRNLVGVLDPLNRLTQYGYCSCGALISLIDPAGNATAWDRDVQKRPKSRSYADGSKIVYQYDLAGRPASVTDPKGQVKKLSYWPDNNLQKVDYLHAIIPTPSVSFAYDADYNRLTGINDGTGQTQFAYFPYSTTSPPAQTTGAGRLDTKTVPLLSVAVPSAAIRYENSQSQPGYDELGRVNARSIDSVNLEKVDNYDSLGRITQLTNPLGTFNYAYVNATNRLDYVNYPNGQKTKYLYFPGVGDPGTGNGDRRLQEIQNLVAGDGSAVISQFDYTYDLAGRIATWKRQLVDSTKPSGYATTTFGLGYDDDDQLTGATLQDASTSAVQNRNVYGYDLASNRSSEQFDDQTGTSIVHQITKAGYNGVNQLTGKQAGGPMRFSGTLSEPATVTVGGNPATVNGTSFTGYADVAAGVSDQHVTIAATNAAGQTTSQVYSVNVAAGSGAQSFGYDPNGNMNGDGTRVFAWDAENRLVKITKGTGTSQQTQEFIYNGVGQRVAEKCNGTLTRQWVWIGADLKEERDASGNVTKRYYDQGMQIVSLNFYYTRDHLGSIREMVDSSGTARAQYDYDPYGRYTNSTWQPQTQRVNLVTTNPVDADLGFTGHYWNNFASLNLTYCRAYDPTLARWLSRDPIGEDGGANLYRYVENDPENRIDPLGLTDSVLAPGGAARLAAALAGTAAAIEGKCLPDQVNAAQQALEGLANYKKNNARIKAANSLMDRAQDHVNAAAGGPEHGGDDPNNRRFNFKKWLRDTRNFLKQAREELQKCTRDVSEQLNRADAIEQAAKDVEEAGLPPD